MYFFGAVAYIMSVGMFCYFFYINYEASISQAFISLTSSAGDCSPVPIAVTGTYLGDVNGNCNGDVGYTDALAIYSLSFSNFQISNNQQYTQMMSTFYNSLEYIGNK